jgi:transcriptional regulator with PAS, ATPase and Fis domain
MPFSLQPKLLRVLQDMEFERVGDNKTRKIDVRVIAATNKNLADEIAANRFRQDLYYRLCVVPITMPPLRERKEDIPLLIRHFLKKRRKRPPNKPISEITPSALSALLDYDWPGNVRELENAIEHACIRTRSDKIDLDSLPKTLKGPVEKNAPSAGLESSPMPMNVVQKHFINELMKKYNGNRTLVAKDLGISRTTLWRKLREGES